MIKKFTLKTILILCACILPTSITAQKSVEESFATNPNEWLPTSAPITATDFKSPTTEQTWSIKECYFSSQYLMMNRSKGELVLPVQDYKVGKVIVTSSGSTSTATQLSLYAGTTLVETKPITDKSTDFEWVLNGQEAGTKYTLAVANAKNCQIVKVVIKEATTTPEISFKEVGNLMMGSVLNGTFNKSVTVQGSNLAEDINVAITGVNASKFSVSPVTLPAEGGEITVSYNGGDAGQAGAEINLTSGGVTVTKAIEAVTAAHTGEEDNPLTVKDVVDLDNSLTGTYWVEGIIGDGCAGNVTAQNESGITTNIVNSNIVLVQDGVTLSVPVHLLGDARSVLNIKDNEANIGQSVLLCGSLTTYFSRAGIDDIIEFYEPTSGVEGVARESVAKVFGEKGEIVIAGDASRANVWNANGVPVKVSGNKIICPAGLYLVGIGGKITKVLVR